MTHFKRITLYLALFALSLGFVSTVAAEEEPLRTSLINVSKKGGDSAYGRFESFLDDSDDIDLRSQKRVLSTAKKQDISIANLRSSKWRRANPKKLKRLIEKSKLESLLLVDVYSKGRKVQLVAIAPNGKQVADVEESIKGGKVSKSKARGMLRQAFGGLIPAVKSARAGEDEEEEEEEDVEDEDPDDEDDVGDGDDVEDGDDGGDDDGFDDEDGIAKKNALAKKRGEYASIQTGFRLKAGLLLGRRALNLTSDSAEFELNHESPFAGLGAELQGIFANFGDSAVGFALSVGYAPFTTIFEENQEFSSAFTNLGAELRYYKAFSPQFLIKVIGGADVTSITIDSNPNYTGTRYIAARVGGGLEYLVGPVTLEAALIVLPVLSTNNSDGAFEDPGFSLGFAPNAGLSFGVTKEIAVGLHYTLRYFNPEYPNIVDQGVSREGAAPSSDTVHLGVVSIGYAL